MNAGRQALAQDWECCDYISGTLLDGVISDESMDRLEEQAMHVIESADQKFRLCLSFSAGIDSVVLLHLCYRVGLTDIPTMFSYTPLCHPSIVEYAEVMCERLGFSDVSFYEKSDFGWSWLLEKPEERIFPTLDHHSVEVSNIFEHIRQFMDDVDADLNVFGARGEDNHAPSYISDASYCDDRLCQLNPIKDWETKHVVRYLDRYDVPIWGGYHVHPSPSDAWHRYVTFDTSGNRLSYEDRNWWVVHEIAVRHGYVSYWDEIVERVPRGAEIARTYAEERSEQFTTREEGLTMGADAGRVVPDSFGP